MLPCLCSRKSPHRFRLRLVSLFESRFIPRLRNQFFPQSFGFLVSNLVPLRFLPLFLLSRLHLRTRLDIFNVFFTISSIRSNPSFVLPPYFPTFPSAIFNFYHLAFVNVPSYSDSITVNLFSTRFFNAPTHPPLLVSSPIVANRHRCCRFSRHGDRAWWGGT